MNHSITKQFNFPLSPVLEENESVSPQNTQTSRSSFKNYEAPKSKDIGKIKHGLTLGNRSVYLCKYSGTSARKKPAPVCVHSNPSAEAVLRERKVEIKDLECQVAYLNNRIKEMKVENKTLRDIQSRQEKELRKFKGGVADIPALLRSHKDEVKALEAAAASLRRELWDCQKDMKAKYDVGLRKDQHLDKLNLIIKRNEKRLHEVNLENKELKTDKKKLEEKSKKLVGGNEELKFKNDRFQKKIQEMTNEILNLEVKLGTVENYKVQLEDDLFKLHESLQYENDLKKKLQTITQTVGTQTPTKEYVSKACMTTDGLFGYTRTEGIILSTRNLEEDDILNKTNGHINAKSSCWNQSEDTSSQKNQDKKTLQPLKHTLSGSTTKEPNCGDNFLTAIESNNFLQTVAHVNQSYPNAAIEDLHLGNRMSYNNSTTEAENERKYFITSSKGHSVPNERSKHKRLLSNFTLQNSSTPNAFLNLNKF